MKAIFPSKKTFIKSLYHQIHCQYLVELFKYCGYEIEYTDNVVQLDEVVFEVVLNDVKFYVDFGDHLKIHTNNRPLIKYHLDKNLKNTDIIPISPISFYDWKQYFELEKKIQYTFGKTVLNNQVPGGAAVKRRLYLKDLIVKSFSNSDTEITNQLDYWKKINTAKVAVFAPGARIDILDRGQLQYMAFGCCTISPELNDKITFNKEPIAGIHYIKCKDDFSDVVNIVESLSKDVALKIGNNAKQLFKETCLPTAIIPNILSRIGINL